MKMKNYLGMDTAIENHMKSLSKQRDFSNANKMGLFNFGHELYDSGHDYEDFLADIIVCFITPKDQSEEVYNSLADKYMDTNSFPDLQTIIKIATNTNYLQAIKSGYERAKKIADFTTGRKKK